MKDYERVNVDEAIRLAGYQTLDAFDYVEKIIETEAQRQAVVFPTQSPLFNLIFGAFVAWEAGRVAGIRAERERRNNGKHTCECQKARHEAEGVI